MNIISENNLEEVNFQKRLKLFSLQWIKLYTYICELAAFIIYNTESSFETKELLEFDGFINSSIDKQREILCWKFEVKENTNIRRT